MDRHVLHKSVTYEVPIEIPLDRQVLQVNSEVELETPQDNKPVPISTKIRTSRYDYDKIEIVIVNIF